MNVFLVKTGLALVLVVAVGALVGGEKHWDLEAAQKQAAAEEKTLVIEFYTKTCPNCVHFQRSLDKQDAKVMKALSNVVLVQIDEEEPRGKQLAKRYGSLAVPTFIVLNQELEPVSRFEGFSPNFSKDLARALNKTLTVPERVLAYQNDPDPQTAYELGRTLRSQKDFAGALAMFDDIGASGDESITDLQQQILLTMIDHEMDYPGTYTSAFLDTYAQAVYHERCESKWRVTSMMRYYSQETGRPRLYKKYLRDFMTHALDDYGIDVRTHPRFHNMRYRIALHIDGDLDKAVRLMPTSFPKNWRDQFGYVLYYAYWLSDHYVQLEEARDLAHQALTMASTQKERSNSYYVLAQIEYLLGDTAMATHLIEEALVANLDYRDLHDEYACLLEMQQQEQVHLSAARR